MRIYITTEGEGKAACATELQGYDVAIRNCGNLGTSLHFRIRSLAEYFMAWADIRRLYQFSGNQDRCILYTSRSPNTVLRDLQNVFALELVSHKSARLGLKVPAGMRHQKAADSVRAVPHS